MNVYKYRFDLGDSVSRPTPWPTLSLLHQLPLAQEEGPQKRGKESSRTLSPEPSLGPGRVRHRAWQTRSLLRGLESGGASACSLPNGLPGLTLPSGSPTTSQPTAVWLPRPPLLTPCRPPLLFRHLPVRSPVPPALTCSDWTARFRCAPSPMDCALGLSRSSLPSRAFPPHTSSHSLSPASSSIHPQSWLTLIFLSSHISCLFLLPWLFHSVLFPDTHLSNSPCFL